ncbi:MAG: hypothetical protein PHQ43_14605, partial [Dehalococcoidales bacterium]|nr:hypothetical protein [Dehalococcoidales bacterium]
VTGIEDDEDWTDYDVTLPIEIYKIDTAFGPKPGLYRLQVKLHNLPGLGADIYWEGEDDIELISSEAEFGNLQVSYANA